MAATFVRWNPSLNPGSRHDIIQAAFATAVDPLAPVGFIPNYLSNWTVRVPDQTHDGDTIFMTQWGENGFAGLLGIGVVAGSQYKDLDWKNGAGDLAVYVPIRWNYMLMPGSSIDPLTVLRRLPGAQWPQLESGETLPDHVAVVLRELVTKSRNEAAKARKQSMKPKRAAAVRLAVFDALVGNISKGIQAISLTTFKKRVRLTVFFHGKQSELEQSKLNEMTDELEIVLENLGITKFDIKVNESTPGSTQPTPRLDLNESLVYINASAAAILGNDIAFPVDSSGPCLPKAAAVNDADPAVANCANRELLLLTRHGGLSHSSLHTEVGRTHRDHLDGALQMLASVNVST